MKLHLSHSMKAAPGRRTPKEPAAQYDTGATVPLECAGLTALWYCTVQNQSLIVVSRVSCASVGAILRESVTRFL